MWYNSTPPCETQSGYTVKYSLSFQISLVFTIHFTLYSSSRHNTDTVSCQWVILYCFFLQIYIRCSYCGTFVMQITNTIWNLDTIFLIIFLNCSLKHVLQWIGGDLGLEHNLVHFGAFCMFCSAFVGFGAVGVWIRRHALLKTIEKSCL